VVNIESDIKLVHINDMIFFKVGLNDTKNGVIFGQDNGYCWNNECLIKDIRSIYIYIYCYFYYNIF